MTSIRRARRRATPAAAYESSAQARNTPRSRDAYQTKILRQHAGGFNGAGSARRSNVKIDKRANPPRPLERPGFEQGRERVRADYSQTLMIFTRPERVYRFT